MTYIPVNLFEWRSSPFNLVQFAISAGKSLSSFFPRLSQSKPVSWERVPTGMHCNPLLHKESDVRFFSTKTSKGNWLRWLFLKESSVKEFSRKENNVEKFFKHVNSFPPKINWWIVKWSKKNEFACSQRFKNLFIIQVSRILSRQI